MDEINRSGQEEYIWAMRMSAFCDSDSELWQEARAIAPVYGSERRIIKSKSNIGNTIGQRQTKVMASLLPDEVLFNVDDYSIRSYDACFLFGDVSGFTELCEKYNKTGISGPSRMTQVLNKYLGAMVQEILSHGGDVLKFSGDAFLAIFKTSENETMRDTVHAALDCALVIQKTYGQYKTDVGVIIKVKLAISAGPVMFALIGEEKNSHYVVVGKPIWDVKAAESISTAGDIIISPAAWHYVNPNEYIFHEMDDGIHIKLLGVGPNWRSVQKNVHQQKLVRDSSEDFSSGSSSSRSGSDSLIGADAANDEFSLRPSVNAAIRLNIKDNMRKFIIAPVMKSIDMDEPFEYLTEMRQSSIVFINVVSKKLDTKGTVILADQTYKIVCSVVHMANGCVNKVSLFDKDLMFVVIFGLRGLKHELECQIALRCATECHNNINKLPGVLTTSIGVTTGKCYCGVFGHTLRREYTVISLIVNKAARLMVAYKNKVTCDRETFLHSKMEARNFILQEAKPLKGITRPGPVYEFKEAETLHTMRSKLNPCPLLGRDDMMKIYTDLQDIYLDPKVRAPEYKMLLIHGEAREGKSRLLDEILCTSLFENNITSVKLNIKDKKIPYQTIRLLFCIPLGIPIESARETREEKIKAKLKKKHVSDMLCVYNEIFMVNFKQSKEYSSMDLHDKYVAMWKMMKLLSTQCFAGKWLVGIDDADYIDNESWLLMSLFLSIKNVFMVATMAGSQSTVTEQAKKFMADPQIKSVVLKPIDRWYHGALACQIMNVYAIPAELEKVIQSQSNGNPGWIESFLISLIQDDGLYIFNADMRQVNELGLVCPPLYMMTRMSPEATLQWKHVMEERRSTTDASVEGDDWQRYIDSCRDSYLNIVVREQMEKKTTEGKVRVCITSPTFKMTDVEAELSLDVMVMKTFDSLNSYEQLMVKCSAILGNQFPRDMLIYVMSATKVKQTAIAVQKLFEIKVFNCAKGDFLEGGNMLFRERLNNPNDDTTIKCECRGISIDESCTSLPRYASCGYMQFRSALFRDITYNLLTDNQKKEFHNRAIRYLEKETRRCRSCGNGFFEEILEKRQDQDLLLERDRHRKNGFALLNTGSFDSGSAHKRLSIQSRDHMGSVAYMKKRDSRYDEKSIGSSPSANMYHAPSSFHGKWGFSIIRRLKNRFSLTRAFSAEDFTDCQCNLILNTTYAQLVDHCRGANEIAKMVEAMERYAYICIISSNIPLALTILDQSFDSMEELALTNKDHLWKVSLIRARIYMLVGYARLELGDYMEAQKNLRMALAEYDRKFPHTGYVKPTDGCLRKMRQLFGFYIFPSTLIKHLDYWEIIYSNDISQCLAYFCTLYRLQGRWPEALLAARWSLSRALASYSDFTVLCNAYANMLGVSVHMQNWRFCTALEVHALKLCQIKHNKIEIDQLKAVAKLYGVIFTSRMFRSDIEKCIHIGYIVLRICSSIHAVKVILPLLPLLMDCLMMGNHISNAITMLQELEYFSEEDTDSSGKVWYFALCIGFHLESGYSVVPYSICEKFYQIEGEGWTTIRDPDARRRYFTVMWLWCVRNEDWDAADLWCIKTAEFMEVSKTDSLANMFTALYLLEGLILYLVCKMNRRNIKAVVEAESEIDFLVQELEAAVKISNIIAPRLYHLKAYYRHVKYNDSKVEKLITKALQLANKLGNQLEASWIEHSRKAWYRTLSTVAVDFWKDHCELENTLDFHEIDLSSGAIGFFTLPTPKFV